MATGLIYYRLRSGSTKDQSALAREHLKSDDMLLVIEVLSALMHVSRPKSQPSIEQIEGSVKKYMVENEGAILDRFDRRALFSFA